MELIARQDKVSMVGSSIVHSTFFSWCRHFVDEILSCVPVNFKLMMSPSDRIPVRNASLQVYHVCIYLPTVMPQKVMHFGRFASWLSVIKM